MNRLRRYLMSQVLALTGIVALGLVTIYSLVVFVSELNELGKGDYGVADVLAYSGLMLPGSLYILMPIIALLGTLMGVGALARSSELTAMRAAGISFADIGAVLLLVGVLLGGFAFVLGDWIAPASERYAETLRDTARGGDGSIGRSVWLRESDRILQIRQLVAEDEVRDVTVYRIAEDGRLSSMQTVQEGHFDGSHWQLKGVRRTSFEDNTAKVATLDTAQLEGGISPNVLKLFILESDSLSSTGLVRLIRYLDSNHLDAGKYRLALWRKLVEPFTVTVMMIFALPFAVGRMRDAGAGQRLLVGMLMGVAFYVGNKVCVSLGDIYGWPAPAAAAAPTLVLTAIAAWRLKRAQ